MANSCLMWYWIMALDMETRSRPRGSKVEEAVGEGRIKEQVMQADQGEMVDP